MLRLSAPLALLSFFLSVAAAAAQPIVVAGTLPLTGSEARAAQAFREGYELAVDEVNAGGGLKLGGATAQVKLRLLDDRNSAQASVDLARQLAGQRDVAALLGTFGSELVLSQSAVAGEKRIPYVAGSSSAGEIFAKGNKYVFGLMSPSRMMAVSQLDWVLEQQAHGRLPTPARLAVAVEATAHGRDFRAGVQRMLGRAGGKLQLVFDESFPLETKDFKPLVAKLRDAHATVFLADAHFPDFLALHRQHVAAHLCEPVVSYGARGSEAKAAQELGAPAVQYLLTTTWWAPQLRGNPISTKFVEAYQARHHHAPEWYHAMGYESARVLLAAIGRAGSADREAIRAQLATMKIDSMLPGAQLSFPADTGQQAHYPYLVLQNQPDGKAEILYPAYLATKTDAAPDPRCR